MDRTYRTKFSSGIVAERLPWPVRGLLGCGFAALSVGLTYAIVPFRAFPFLIGFPTVVLGVWFLGMWGGIVCGLTEVVLVNYFLTKQQFRFSIGFVTEGVRLTVFLSLSLLLGWAIRRMASQRAELTTRDLEHQLHLADAQRQLAEERASASEALRDRDEMLQIALQANGMGPWAWDFEHGTVHFSDEMYSIYGREPGSIEQTAEAWMQLIHPEDLGAVTDAVNQARDAGTEIHIEYRVPWPDGSVHWVEVRGKSQRNSGGLATRLVGVAADVTSRKRGEEAMLRAEKLAVAGRLAASVAHEINNPLEAVMNLLYLIARSDTPEEAHEHAEVATGELMRVSLITQQTLKFHRQAGRPTLVKLSEVVAAVLGLFRGKLAFAQIETQVLAKREACVSCMPGEIHQIFANLVSNAIDAMPNGGRLTIRLRPSRDWRDDSTVGMRVTFCDSGIGMDRATVRQIFEPFFTTKADTGTGLGMWVVAQLVERHDGDVRVLSRHRPGASGTAFSVFLPLGDPPADSMDIHVVPAAQANLG
jgi:PAS domain S-box-containing protein